MSLFPAELAGEQQGPAARPPAEILERLETARRVDRDRSQKLRQLLRAAGIEGAIGPARELGELFEGGCGDGFMTFVEQEDRQAQHPELARKLAQLIR